MLYSAEKDKCFSVSDSGKKFDDIDDSRIANLWKKVEDSKKKGQVEI
jgi:hypothetical protein